MVSLAEQQLTRFNSTSILTNYVCEREYFEDGLTVYEPTCEFPYVNKGWASDGDEGFEDVVLGDCSITYADASGGSQALSNTIYTILYVLVFPMLVAGECST